MQRMSSAQILQTISNLLLPKDKCPACYYKYQHMALREGPKKKIITTLQQSAAQSNADLQVITAPHSAGTLTSLTA